MAKVEEGAGSGGRRREEVELKLAGEKEEEEDDRFEDEIWANGGCIFSHFYNKPLILLETIQESCYYKVALGQRESYNSALMVRCEMN